MKSWNESGDYAVIGVGVTSGLNAGTIASAGIGLCNAASTSVRARTAEAFRPANRPPRDNINEAARLAMDDSTRRG
jgi:CO/xanthine dehydrogenase FAD-binding subunit